MILSDYLMKWITPLALTGLLAILWLAFGERQHPAVQNRESWQVPAEKVVYTHTEGKALQCDSEITGHEYAWQTVPQNKNLLIIIP